MGLSAARKMALISLSRGPVSARCGPIPMLILSRITPLCLKVAPTALCAISTSHYKELYSVLRYLSSRLVVLQLIKIV